ncbi:MAG: hypothetical protein ABIQ30_13650 [Devosia sp.]
MQRVLITNGVFERELGKLPKTIAILNLDLPLAQSASAEHISVTQGDTEVELDRRSTVHFLPFRSPFEASDQKLNATALYDGVALLLTLLNMGVSLRSDPFKWLRAYDRSVLFALGDLVAVPALELYQGVDHLDARQDDKGEYLVKSGLGVKKSHGAGNYLAASLLPQMMAPLRVPTKQRFAVQRYIPAEREVRLYAIIGADGAFHSTAIEMPVGERQAPDWRDNLAVSKLRVEEIADPQLELLGRAVIGRLGLAYMCIDLLLSVGRWHLIDVNPHGSWSWLPKKSATAVRDMVNENLFY